MTTATKRDFAERLRERTERWNDPQYRQQQQVLARLRKTFAEAERKRAAERRAGRDEKRKNLTLVCAAIAAVGSVGAAIAGLAAVL